MTMRGRFRAPFLQRNARSSAGYNYEVIGRRRCGPRFVETDKSGGLEGRLAKWQLSTNRHCITLLLFATLLQKDKTVRQVFLRYLMAMGGRFRGLIP